MYKTIKATEFESDIFVLKGEKTGKLWPWKVWTNKKEAEEAALVINKPKARNRRRSKTKPLPGDLELLKDMFQEKISELEDKIKAVENLISFTITDHMRNYH